MKNSSNLISAALSRATTLSGAPQCERRAEMSLEWRRSLLKVGGASALVLVLFWPTIQTMVDVWAHSRTFSHGFLIAPATLYLLFCYRDVVLRLTPTASRAGVVMLTGLGASWLIGHVHGFVHLQQLAVVGMFPSLVWTVMGTEVVRALWFPLGFLVFAVPIGTFLEPWLQVFTANFIELGLRFADVPVQRQGYVLSIPSGLWEVAPDCGGLRYVLPGMALAYLYAALLFRDGLRRAAILILSFVLLIVANGLRAYTIVLADHVGIASGADHRFYSYTIYGVTVLAMLWLGNVLRDAS